MYYTDALLDESLYAVWMVQTYDAGQLQCLLRGYFQNEGYTIPPHAFQNETPLACADILANNFPPQDDTRWEAHCWEHYAHAEDPCETDAERQGGRVL